MKKKSLNNKIILFDLLLVFLILSFSYSFQFSSLFKPFSYGMSIFAIISSFIIAMKQKIKIYQIILYYFIYIFYNVLFLFYNFSLGALYIVLQEIMLLLFSIIIIAIKFDDEYLIKLQNSFSFVYYVLLSIVFILHLSPASYLISYSVCKAIFALSYFAFCKSNHKLFFCFFSSLIFILMGERTSGAIFLIIYGIYFLEGKINKKFLYNMLFWGTVLFLVAFVLIYIKLPNTDLGISLNIYSRKYFHENLFSGRHVLWANIFDLISNNKLFGLSYSNNILLYYNAVVSSHNLYLWILLNGGYVMLTLFILLMYQCWKLYYIFIKETYVRASSSYFLGLLILCNFELLLLTNNFSVSLVMWFIISLGLNYVLHHTSEK